MAKKNKKFKKKIQSVIATTSLSDQTGVISPETQVQNIIAAAAKTEVSAPDQNKILDERYEYVRHDVKRLFISLGAIILAMIAFFILNTQTSVLSTFGDWLYRIGHFSI